MFKGGCFCGRIRYVASGVPFNATICHCVDCRRATGSPLVGWFTVRPPELAFVLEQPRRFASSPGVQRSFCPGCGTSLTYQRDGKDEVDVTICSLDDANALLPEDHVFAGAQLEWIVLGDDLPKHRRQRLKTTP